MEEKEIAKFKVFVIYCSECKQFVEEIRNKLELKTEVLRLRDISEDTPEKTTKKAWHDNAIKMIKQADVIVYVVSEHTAENENVEWELKQCIDMQKHIICLKLSPEYEISKSFYYLDSFTKEKKCRGEVARNEEALYLHIDDLIGINTNLDKQYLIEFYKSFSETAESLLGRRQSMNSFFASANAALITVGATVFALSEGENTIPKILILIAISIPGIALNVTWINLINSLRINHKAKISVLSGIEKAFGASLYDDEWKKMKNEYNKNSSKEVNDNNANKKKQTKYKSTSEIEKPVPIAFITFFSAICFISIIFALATLIFKI